MAFVIQLFDKYMRKIIEWSVSMWGQVERNFDNWNNIWVGAFLG
jgi:hypothetical protein